MQIPHQRVRRVANERLAYAGPAAVTAGRTTRRSSSCRSWPNDEAYRERKPEVEGAADQIVGYLRRLAEPTPPASPVTIDNPFIESLLDRIVADYDSTNGASAPPKFPRARRNWNCSSSTTGTSRMNGG